MSGLDRAATSLEDRDFAQLEKRCKILAASSLVPRRFKNKAGDLMVVAIAAHDLDVPFGPRTLKQFWISPDGSVELTAQMQVALARRTGYHLWFPPGSSSATEATVHVTTTGDLDEHQWTYTLERARRAHRLDEWVQRETQTGETWPDGNPKTATERFVIAIDGDQVDGELPEWVTREVEAGRVHRFDAWWNYREDMLMARACTLALKYEAPHVMHGLDFGGSDLITEDRPEDIGGRPVVDVESVDITRPPTAPSPPRPDEAAQKRAKGFHKALAGAELSDAHGRCLVALVTAGRSTQPADMTDGEADAARQHFERIRNHEEEFHTIAGQLVLVPSEQAPGGEPF